MNPAQALEAAVYAFAADHTFSDVAATSIYKGIENPTVLETESGDDESPQVPNRVHPSLTIIADGSHEEICLGTKSFRGTLILRVEADGQNVTDSDFNDICEDVFSKFDITTLPAAINAAKPGFYVYAANIIDNGHSVHNGVNWTNELIIDAVYAQASL